MKTHFVFIAKQSWRVLFTIFSENVHSTQQKHISEKSNKAYMSKNKVKSFHTHAKNCDSINWYTKSIDFRRLINDSYHSIWYWTVYLFVWAMYGTSSVVRKSRRCVDSKAERLCFIFLWMKPHYTYCNMVKNDHTCQQKKKTENIRNMHKNNNNNYAEP